MTIKVILNKKIKEKAFLNAVKEYSKRISRYCKFEVIYGVTDSALQSYISDRTYIIEVKNGDESISSPCLAEHISELALRGKSDIVFIVKDTGELDAVTPDFSFGISNFDIEYRLLCVMLVEQVYRAFKINSGEPYHK